MKHNLLNTFDEEVKPILFDELKRESPTIDKVIYQHLTIIHASILGGLIEKSKKPNGAKAIKNLIEKGNHNGSITNRISEIFGDEEQLSDIKKLGNSLLAFVFDDGTDKAFEKIQHFLSEKYLTKEEDLIDVNRMIAPFSMGLIGQIIHEEEMSDQEIGQLLNSNEPFISMRFPGLAKVLGLKPNTPDIDAATPSESSLPPSDLEDIDQFSKPTDDKTTDKDGSTIEIDDDQKLFLKSLWPWVLMLVVAVLSLFVLKKFEADPVSTLEAKQDNPFNFIQSDSLNIGNTNAYTLPGNVRLEVDENSNIDSLLIELENANGQIDTLRYRSSRISFKDSTAILTSAANKELADLLTVLQSYSNLYMNINLYYNETYLAQNPSLTNNQIKSLADYFTVFGLNQSRVNIFKTTTSKGEPEEVKTITDTTTQQASKTSRKNPESKKGVELVFFHIQTNKEDSLNIQE